MSLVTLLATSLPSTTLVSAQLFLVHLTMRIMDTAGLRLLRLGILILSERISIIEKIRDRVGTNN
ncbi:hypothetical protein N7471_006208 [Penicillium samsonianum]|uniref:uncharacterized protein n=1 Tax=Penicillium samsonianum TaxID=1882272 RepID=UPI00254690ED|nr:uncharacterized protein N7471_006208 [Penicillium samsonianum]KAJ6139722.1 hypothetical protein N7471_006208 [Penicillium samsonianum]